MALSDEAALSDELAAVVGRYHRRERLASGAVVAVVVAVLTLAALRASLLVFLAIALVTLVVVRAPVFRSHGTARLRSAAAPADVVAAFEDPRPPLLSFQWGIAEAVRATDDGAVYELSYLFGLRSVTMTVETGRLDADADGATAALELRVTAGDRPWGTYEVTVRPADGGGSLVDVAWDSDRRFGLRQLPGWLVAERYRAGALSAQGFEVADRASSLTPWSG
jgi:hypothetical protein